MDTELVIDLLKAGKTPRQIAETLGYKRKEVEALAEQLASARRAHRMKRLFIPLLVLLAVGAGLLVLNNILKEPTNLEVYSNVVKVSDSLASAPAGGSWFIEQENKPRNADDLDAELPLIQRLTRQMDKALADNIDVPWVKEEQEMFGGHFLPSIFSSYQGGTTRTMTTNPESLKDPKQQEVVFYGHFAFNHPRIKHRLLFYDAGWRALIVAALNFTDERWYDAILSHELWHAKMHRENNPTATAPMLSEPWVTEELWAHDIELEVLNARTGGEYKRRLQAIVARRPARSMKRFLLGLQPQDLRELDGLFKPGISEERDLRAAQYALNLAHAWLDGKFRGEEMRQKRIEAYRFLIDPSQSTNVQ